jgi:hypothetical protein
MKESAWGGKMKNLNHIKQSTQNDPMVRQLSQPKPSQTLPKGHMDDVESGYFAAAPKMGGRK